MPDASAGVSKAVKAVAEIEAGNRARTVERNRKSAQAGHGPVPGYADRVATRGCLKDAKTVRRQPSGKLNRTKRV